MSDPIMQFFSFDNLKPELQAIASIFFDAACKVTALCPRNPERTVALRKLLEAKDAAVRAKLFQPVDHNENNQGMVAQGQNGDNVINR